MKRRGMLSDDNLMGLSTNKFNHVVDALLKRLSRACRDEVLAWRPELEWFLELQESDRRLMIAYSPTRTECDRMQYMWLAEILRKRLKKQAERNAKKSMPATDFTLSNRSYQRFLKIEDEDKRKLGVERTETG